MNCSEPKTLTVVTSCLYPQISQASIQGIHFNQFSQKVKYQFHFSLQYSILQGPMLVLRQKLGPSSRTMPEFKSENSHNYEPCRSLGLPNYLQSYSSSIEVLASFTQCNHFKFQLLVVIVLLNKFPNVQNSWFNNQTLQRKRWVAGNYTYKTVPS